MENHRIINVYGVWDCIDGKWFDDCPVVIQFDTGFLCVNVKSEQYLSLGWNDIDISEKPYWFCSQSDSGIINDLNWQEDLAWRKYEVFSAVINSPVVSVKIIGNTYGTTGITFETQANTLCIEDNGDCIIAYLRK